jgi:hypothetical protein
LYTYSPLSLAFLFFDEAMEDANPMMMMMRGVCLRFRWVEGREGQLSVTRLKTGGKGDVRRSPL